MSRRTAMKAAVGGAVAAGVFVAPRVEGFTLVPDYASAASGNDQIVKGDVSTITSQAAPAALCLLKCCVTCWNSSGVTTICGRSTCTCGTHKSCGNSATDRVNGTLVVNKNSPPGSSINLAYSLWGPTEGCSNQTPSLNMTLAGITGAYQSCTVQVSGTCNTGTFVGAQGPTTFTTNGTVPVATPPSCTGSIANTAPAAERCSAPAALTITLACTFS